LDVGFGIGVHGELSLIPLINVGPYYLHYELSSADRPALGAADAVFNALGLRARSILPVPGSFKPYGYVGIGYVWASYSPALGNRTGHLIEIPIGVGVAFEKILELFQITADVAYRPAFGFGGDAFNGIGAANHPTSGWSVLLGAAIAL
jgi:hypothetical protein